MSNELPPSKAMPYLISLAGMIVGALVSYWTVVDRMKAEITERVNLVSRVAQLGERIDGLKSDVANLRADLNAVRNKAP